jgi:hypothetical protein
MPEKIITNRGNCKTIYGPYLKTKKTPMAGIEEF